ncbi:MAG: ATP-binding protein [Lewinellaceae bacterium]|nr:ATP-binding protein [Lewinellaceae bacterium]
MIFRIATHNIVEDLDLFPVVAIIGSRQVGKTTLAKSIGQHLKKKTLYLDLESENDLAKLASPETYLSEHFDKCVIIDEVQTMPRLFPIIRSLVDKQREPARFILLGSASPELLRNSSESLAGRIVFHELSPFSLPEIAHAYPMREHWLRGGFPDAFLAKNFDVAKRWLENFTKTFVERDLRRIIGYEVEPLTMSRFIRMLGHLHGQILNAAEISRSMDISVQSVNKYLYLLEGAFLTQKLEPYFRNLGKRLTKSPKFYFNDSGFHHTLVRIPDLEGLYSSQMLGVSWEGYVIQQIRRVCGDRWNYFFYRTQHGAEIDLLLETPSGKLAAIEIKYSNAPSVSKGFYLSCEDLNPDFRFIVTPESESYLRDSGIRVCGLLHFLLHEIPSLD